MNLRKLLNPGAEGQLRIGPYNTIQYKFYCQLPMEAFQRQILIVQVSKKTNKQTKEIHALRIT